MISATTANTRWRSCEQLEDLSSYTTKVSFILFEWNETSMPNVTLFFKRKRILTCIIIIILIFVVVVVVVVIIGIARHKFIKFFSFHFRFFLKTWDALPFRFPLCEKTISVFFLWTDGLFFFCHKDAFYHIHLVNADLNDPQLLVNRIQSKSSQTRRTPDVHVGPWSIPLSSHVIVRV